MSCPYTAINMQSQVVELVVQYNECIKEYWFEVHCCIRVYYVVMQSVWKGRAQGWGQGPGQDVVRSGPKLRYRAVEVQISTGHCFNMLP